VLLERAGANILVAMLVIAANKLLRYKDIEWFDVSHGG